MDVLEADLRNGLPMVQLHYERLNKLWAYEERQRQKAARALLAAQEPPPIPRDMLESLRRFDLPYLARRRIQFEQVAS